jgi:hypothetical protein
MEENTEIIYFIDRTSNPIPPLLDFMNDDQNNENQNVPVPVPVNNTNDFSDIVKLIKSKLKRGIKEYHFRPYRIDGVYCYIVLYLEKKILTIESINIKCYFNDIHSVPYVLYHKKYKSIEKIVQLIHEVTTTYKIINGDLLCKTDYNDIKIEEKMIPYKEDEICCVCLEHTTDNTTCGHFICFSCRDKCIIQKKRDCPMCRTKNVLSTYSNVMNLINNVDYSELNELFYSKIYQRQNVDNDHDNNSIISSSSDEDDEEEDEQEVEEEEEEEAHVDQELQEINLQQETIRNTLREVGLYDTDDE